MDLLDRIKKEDDKIKVCFFTASEEFASNYQNIFNNSKDLIILKPISIPIMAKQIEQFLYCNQTPFQGRYNFSY
jgi:two-component SAPR family response regulator